MEKVVEALARDMAKLRDAAPDQFVTTLAASGGSANTTCSRSSGI